MKKINKGQFRFILFLSLFLTLSFSCQRVMDDGEEDDVSSSDGTALKIMARSGGNTSIEYIRFICMLLMRKETVRQSRR